MSVIRSHRWLVLVIALVGGGGSVRAADWLWTGCASGEWNAIVAAEVGSCPLQNVSNWIPDQPGYVANCPDLSTCHSADAPADPSFPGPLDRVTFNSPVDHSGGGDGSSISGLLGNAVLTLSSGTLAIADASSLDASVLNAGIALTGGRLTGDGHLTLRSDSLWTAGQWFGTGTTRIDPGASLTISGSADRDISARELRNDGTLTWADDARIECRFGAVVRNTSTFVVTGNGILDRGIDGCEFFNEGTFERSGGTGTFEIDATSENTGHIDVLTGTLRMNNVVHTGTVHLEDGAELRFGTSQFGIGSGVTGDGRVRLVSGGLEALSGATVPVSNLRFDGGNVHGGGDVVVTGSFEWAKGNIQGPGILEIEPSATLEISGTAPKNLFADRTIEQKGTGVWIDDGTVDCWGDALFHNTGTFRMEGNGTFDGTSDGGTCEFLNDGTFRRSVGLGTATMDASYFHNVGAVEVESGTLELSSQGTHSGSFAVAEDAILSMRSAETLLPGASFTGDGLTRFNHLVHVEAGAIVPMTRVEQTGGSVRGPGEITVAQSWSWLSGILGDLGTLTIQAGAELSLSSPGTKHLAERTLVNLGHATWVGTGEFHVSEGGEIHNEIGALFDVQNHQTLDSANGGGRFVNRGEFRKSADGERTDIDIYFDNFGALRVTTGQVRFRQTFTQEAGSLELVGGDIESTQTMRLRGGMLTGMGTVGAIRLELDGGAIAGTDTLAFTGRLVWLQGSMGDPGTTAITETGELEISGSAMKTWGTRTITNAGIASWVDDGDVFGSSGTFDNLDGAEFTAGNESELSGFPTFNNHGTFLREGSSGETTWGGLFANRGLVRITHGSLHCSGLYVQESGTTDVRAVLAADQTLDFAGGVLTGTGEVLGNVSMRGEVRPGIANGILEIDGDYTQHATGKLTIDMSGTDAGTGHDRLDVAGVANLDGALEIALGPGYEPSEGDSWEVMKYASHVGTFSSLPTTETSSGLRFAVDVQPTRVVIEAVVDCNENGIADATDIATDTSDDLDGNGEPDECQLVAAAFDWEPFEPRAGETVQLMDRSTGGPHAWEWDLDGDGVPETAEQNPTQVFSIPGTYTVTMSAMNTVNRDEKTSSISIGASGVRVTDVVRTFPGVFLEGTDVNNSFTVSVDWNGLTPGYVRFSVDGGPHVDVPANEGGAVYEFAMGDDFIPRFGAPSRVKIQPFAAGEVEGLARIEDVWVFPYPTWLAFALSGANLPYKVQPGEIRWDIEFMRPDPPWCTPSAPCKFTVPGWVPLLEGSWGVSKIFGTASGRLSSNGTGTLTIRGSSGFEVASQAISGTVEGSGRWRIGPPEGLDLTRATLGIDVEGRVRVKEPLISLLPSGRLVNLLLDFKAVKQIVEAAEVTGEMGPNLDATLVFAQNDQGQLAFDNTEFEAGVEVKLILEVEPHDSVELSAWLGGGGGVTLAVPQPPFLRQATLKVQAGFEVKIDNWWVPDIDGTAEVSCTYAPPNLTCKGPFLTEAAALGETGLTGPVQLRQERVAYGRFGPYSRAAFEGIEPDTVVANVFPGADPCIAETSGGRLLIWSHVDPVDPMLQANEIAWSFDDGGGWSSFDLISDDTQAEIHPQAAVDGDGDVVAVWMRVKDPAFSDSIEEFSDLPTLYSLFELVSAVFDSTSGTWGPVTPITADSALDTGHRISSDGAGNLMLTWLSNPGGEFLSTDSNPSSLMYSVWNAASDSWSAPSIVASGLAGALRHTATYDGSEAFVLVPVDPDPEVHGDGELHRFSFDGSIWTDGGVFATGGGDHMAPQAQYDGFGVGHAVWLRDGDLLHATLDEPAPSVIRFGSASMAFHDTRLLDDGDGNLTLLWHEAVGDGPANLFAKIFDHTSGVWSRDRRLTNDAAWMHKDLAAVYGAGDVLHVAYLAREIERTSQVFEIEGEMVTVNNIPQPGRTDLRVISHSRAIDLAIADSDLDIDVDSPEPGDDVRVTATVRNVGDFSTDDFEVQLWIGDPGSGGILLGSETLAGPFVGADTRVLSFDFVHPAVEGDIVVLVDAASEVAEADEGNNDARIYLTNLPPEVHIKATNLTGPAPVSVDFDGSLTIDPDGDAMTFEWFFGDGTEGATGPATTHLFPAPGAYEVLLQVTDSRGGVGIAETRIDVEGGVGSIPDGLTVPGEQLRLGKGTGTDLTLTWGASCEDSRVDYSIYEGSLGQFFAQDALQCSTGGRVSTTATPGPGSKFYLIVPHNGIWEGGYGVGTSTSRQATVGACRPQGVTPCDACGDGVLNLDEACDGTDLDGASCASLGYDAGTLACSFTCGEFNTLGCYFEGCGNGIVEAGETCDEADLGGQSCTSLEHGPGTLGCASTCLAFDVSGCS